MTGLVVLSLLFQLSQTPAQQTQAAVVQLKMAITAFHALELGRTKPPFAAGDPAWLWESSADRLEHIVIQAVIIPLHDLAEEPPLVKPPVARARLRQGLKDARTLLQTLPADRTPGEVGALARLEAVFTLIEKLPQVRVRPRPR